MMQIRTYIINYNRLAWPLKMADYLSKIPGLEIIFVDNSSTYPPLLDWYSRQREYEVIRMNKNYGQNVLWEQNIVTQTASPEYFIATDPDLDLSNIPTDFVSILKDGLKKNKDVCKAGFSLELLDLPDTSYTRYIYRHEINYWNPSLFDGTFYHQRLDTTFAMYDSSRTYSLKGLRTARPYVAKHLPWYYTKENVTDEDIYYINTCSDACSAKTQIKRLLCITETK